MFSSRTLWDRTPNRLSRMIEARRRAGALILDLTESNPTRAGLLPPESVLALLADAASLGYDPAPQGILSAREAVAADYSRRGVAIQPDCIVLTASTSEAYSFLFKLLCDPGDTVLVPRPSYPLFDYLARLENVSVAQYPLDYDGEWHLSLSALRDALTPRTRAVVVVHPNNPTGSFLRREERERLRGLCVRHGLALIADEVFADFSFRDDPRRVPSFAADDGPGLAFSLGGLSKSCGLPQMKLAWIAVSGPRSPRAEALSRLEIIADTYLSVSSPVQHAAPSLLARLPELQAPLVARIRTNLAALDRHLVSECPATRLALDGGWSAVLQVPITMPEEERVCRLLGERGILVHPGFFFDFEREAFLVLSMLTPPEPFAQGISGILADLVL